VERDYARAGDRSASDLAPFLGFDMNIEDLKLKSDLFDRRFEVDYATREWIRFIIGESTWLPRLDSRAGFPARKNQLDR